MRPPYLNLNVLWVFLRFPHDGTVWHAGIQLLLGVVLLCGFAPQAALVASMTWALVVWVFGEGLGQLLTGSTVVAQFGNTVANCRGGSALSATACTPLREVQDVGCAVRQVAASKYCSILRIEDGHRVLVHPLGCKPGVVPEIGTSWVRFPGAVSNILAAGRRRLTARRVKRELTVRDRPRMSGVPVLSRVTSRSPGRRYTPGRSAHRAIYLRRRRASYAHAGRGRIGRPVRLRA